MDQVLKGWHKNVASRAFGMKEGNAYSVNAKHLKDNPLNGYVTIFGFFF